MKAFLRSPQEIVAARGRDVSDIIDEIKVFIDMAEDQGFGEWARGLFGVQSSVDMKNNPAAVEGQKIDNIPEALRSKLQLIGS
jgi:hypothetical protein